MEPHISERTSAIPASGCPELVLVWRGREIRYAGSAGGWFSIGLRRDSDLVVPGTYASRDHANLKWCRNQFQLTDHSTNGTFIQLEDERVSLVHRTSINLWGAGYLSFGEPLSPENVLMFSHA